jgi:hypothetical protein
MKFNKEELKLLISVLESDTQGNWGDGRAESINRLINKIKKEGESK